MWRPVASRYGVVLVEAEFRRWTPTLDLVNVLLNITDVIETDVYTGTGLTVGQDLPKVWLRDSADSERALRSRSRICAVASVSAAVDPTVCATTDDQMFVAWLCETESESDAARIATAAQPSSSHAAFGVAHKRLACIVVARSVDVDVESFETADSLMRLREPILNAVRSSTV